MMNLMTMFADSYATAMNQTASWVAAHPVFTFVSVVGSLAFLGLLTFVFAMTMKEV